MGWRCQEFAVFAASLPQHPSGQRTAIEHLCGFFSLADRGYGRAVWGVCFRHTGKPRSLRRNYRLVNERYGRNCYAELRYLSASCLSSLLNNQIGLR